MLKFITNITFIMIIFVLATALPLSTDIITLNISQPIVDPVNETESPETPLAFVWEETDKDDSTWTLKFTSNKSPMSEEWLNDFELMIDGNKSMQMVYPLADYAIIEAYSDHYLVKVSLIDLFNGQSEDYYAIQLNASSDNIDSNRVETSYSTYTYTGSYSGSSVQLEDYMTLYYPSEDYSELIPVSMEVQTRDNRWRSLYSALSRGDISNLGLYQGYPIMPHSPNIRISDFIATVYLYSDELLPFEGKFDVITESISRSLLSLGYINGVKFVVNDQPTGTFEGVDLNTTFRYDTEIVAYSAYKSSTNQFFIYPVHVMSSQGLSIEDQIFKLWETLKYSNNDSEYSVESTQLIPIDVELIEYDLSNGVLSLTFNDRFNTLYQDKPWLLELLNDSIVETFTSISGVDQVQFNGLEAPLGSKKLLNIIR